MDRKLGLAGAGLAIVGMGSLGACTTTPHAGTTTTTIPSPTLGCYSATGSNDLKIVGAQATLGDVEAYESIDGTCTGGSFTGVYVRANDSGAALTKCQAVDAGTVSVIDLAPWTTPSPGLAGYFGCSPK